MDKEYTIYHIHLCIKFIPVKVSLKIIFGDLMRIQIKNDLQNYITWPIFYFIGIGPVMFELIPGSFKLKLLTPRWK